MQLLQTSALLCSCFQTRCLCIFTSTQHNSISAHVEPTRNTEHHGMFGTKRFVKKTLHIIYIYLAQRVVLCVWSLIWRGLMRVFFTSQFMLNVRVFTPLLRNGEMNRLTYPRAKGRQSIFCDSCCKCYQLIVHTHPTNKPKPIYTNSWYSFHFSDGIHSDPSYACLETVLCTIFSSGYWSSIKYWASFISGCWSSTVL